MGRESCHSIPLITREDILEMDLLGAIIKSGEVSVDELTKVLKCEIEEYEKIGRAHV